MPGFIELETQGPRTLLEPGASVTHREVWKLYAGVAPPGNEEAMAAVFGGW